MVKKQSISWSNGNSVQRLSGHVGSRNDAIDSTQMVWSILLFLVVDVSAADEALTMIPTLRQAIAPFPGTLVKTLMKDAK